MALGVIGIPLQHLLQRLMPALGMDAHSIERLGRQILQQLVVLGADAAKTFERLRSLAPVIVQLFGPGILIVRFEPGIIFGDHVPEPGGGNDLRIGQMRDDLPDAPFARLGRPVQLRAGGTGDRNRHHFRAAAESLQ